MVQYHEKKKEVMQILVEKWHFKIEAKLQKHELKKPQDMVSKASGNTSSSADWVYLNFRKTYWD